MALTDISIKASKPKSKQYKLTDRDGVYLIVNPTGSKKFYLRYFFDSKEKMLLLGTYPETSLSKARELAGAARVLVENGINPSQDRKIKKLHRKMGGRLIKVIALWLRETRINKQWSPSYYDSTRALLVNYVIPSIGKIRITQITTSDLVLPIEKAVSSKYYDTASRIKEHIGSIMRFAIRKKLITKNPADDLADCVPKCTVKHRPALPFERLPEFLQRLESYGNGRASEVTIAAINIVLRCFMRSSELRLGRWPEIDFDRELWDIPVQRTPLENSKIKYSYRGAKMSSYFSPLSRQTMGYLTELYKISGRGALIFPSLLKTNTPLSENTINGALRRMGYDTKVDVCCHGFRTMACSALNESGLWPKDAIERQMNHKDTSEVRAAYIHKAEYLEQRKQMMQWWSDYLDANRYQHYSICYSGFNCSFMDKRWRSRF